MGKILIIKGADFSANKVGDTEIGGGFIQVDLSKYSKSNNSVSIKPDAGSGEINESVANFQSYILPVNAGETYKVTGCGWVKTSQTEYRPVIALKSSSLTEDAIMPESIVISETSNNGSASLFKDVQFTIPAGVTYIQVQGRESSHSGFVQGYELSLYKYEE